MTRTLSFDEARARFTNRYTADHVPAWARNMNPGNGKFYAPQFASDREWYENTRFYGEPDHIGRRDECYSVGATWPHGQWLAQPFVKGQKPVPAEPDYGYLQHGKAPGPFRTERVAVKPAGYPRAGQWMASFEGRWRLVHVQVNRTFIVYMGERITIQIDGV